MVYARGNEGGSVSYGSADKANTAVDIMKLLQILGQGGDFSGSGLNPSQYTPFTAPGLMEGDLRAKLADPSLLGFTPDAMKYNVPSAVSNLQPPGNYSPKANGGPGGPGGGVGQIDPLAVAQQQILQKLMGMAGGGGFDYESALANVRAQISSAYAPQISAIRGMSKNARKEEARNENAVRKMYGAVARFDSRQADKTQSRANQQANALAKLGGSSQRAIKNATESSLTGEGGLLRDLGLQQAAPDTLTPLENMGAKAALQSERQSTGSQQQAMQYGTNAADYMTKLAGAGKLEGANVQSDLLSQLQGYLGNNRLAIAQLLGQKGSAVASAMTDLQSAGAASQQDAFSNWATILGMANDMRQNNIQNQLDAAQAAGQGGAGGINQYLPNNLQDANSILSTGVRPQVATQLQGVLKSLLSSDFMQSGQASGQGGVTTPVTPEYAMAQIEQMAQNAGITDPALIERLKYAAYAAAS